MENTNILINITTNKSIFFIERCHKKKMLLFSLSMVIIGIFRHL